jgi:threonine/homoserine/homoserine lactone efflux protein
MEHLIALAAATLVLVMIPGPNVALIVANSLRRGTAFGLVTVAGTTLGVGLQLLFVVFGLAALIAAVAGVLTWIRWAGVAYLIWLGIRAWMAPAEELSDVRAQNDTAAAAFRRGVMLAAINPKTLIFNAAFLPQFVPPQGDPGTQLVLTAAVFLAVLALGDSVWAGFSGALRPAMLRFSRLRNRLSGGFFITAGIGLAVARDK